MHGQQRVAALLMVVGLVCTVPTARAQGPDEDRRLAKMAAEAESAEQHERVAQEFRARATRLDTQAARLERSARRLERAWYPHEYKAAPMHRAGYTERQQAARARREARESRLLAQRHVRSADDLRNAP